MFTSRNSPAAVSAVPSTGGATSIAAGSCWLPFAGAAVTIPALYIAGDRDFVAVDSSVYCQAVGTGSQAPAGDHAGGLRPLDPARTCAGGQRCHDRLPSELVGEEPQASLPGPEIRDNSLKAKRNFAMTDALDDVRDHYRATGLTERLKTALTALGPEDQRLTPEQLGALDQFHTRGLAATAELAKLAGITADMSVLDVGSGVGGPARFLAATYGCRVTGVDLSQPFVDAARYLTERTGQSGQVSFETASALELPFDDGRFDVVLLQHVAMNISDRARLYREIRRVLKSGGRFATFDVVLNGGEPHYPVPWARTPATSFLLTAAATREAIEPAGFRDAGMARRLRGRQSLDRPAARIGAAAFAKSRRRDGAGLRAAFRQLGTKSHGRPARHPDRGVRGRVNQHLIGIQMSPATIFQIHLVLGYVPWLLCFGAYVWPRLKSMDQVEAQRAIATLHSFRFFGLVFIIPGVVGPNLPAGLRHLRRLRRLRNRIAGHAGASHGEDASALLAVRRCVQSGGGGRHPHRLLPRHPARPSCALGAVGRHVLDPDHLCAPADDHALRRVLFARASSARASSFPHQRCGRILNRIGRATRVFTLPSARTASPDSALSSR